MDISVWESSCIVQVGVESLGEYTEQQSQMSSSRPNIVVGMFCLACILLLNI